MFKKFSHDSQSSLIQLFWLVAAIRNELSVFLFLFDFIVTNNYHSGVVTIEYVHVCMYVKFKPNIFQLTHLFLSLILPCSCGLVLLLVHCTLCQLAWLLFWKALPLAGSNFLQSPRDTIFGMEKLCTLGYVLPTLPLYLNPLVL